MNKLRNWLMILLLLPWIVGFTIYGKELFSVDGISQLAGLSHDTSPETTDKILTEVTATGTKAYTTVAELLSVTQSDSIPTYASLAALEAVDGGDIADDDLAVVVADQNLYFYVADADGGESEDSPSILVPDTTAGTINWELQLWIADGVIMVNSLAAAMAGVTDADGINLTAAQMNSVIVMTGAGDVYIPENSCDTATFQWVTVKSTAAHANSVGSLDASDSFVLSDGTETTAGDEIDLAGAKGSQVTVMCIEANKWWITGEVGTCTDGGET